MSSNYDHDRLKSECRIFQGQCLMSKSRNYYAVIQSDGNFVVYVSCHFHPKNVLWSSNTSGIGVGPYNLTCQKDGNLVLYDSKSKTLWASNTYQNGVFPFELVMQDDGNLILYDSFAKASWATNTQRI